MHTLPKPTWQRRRGDFNHDWLKNQFILALESWLNLLDDKIESSELEQTFLTAVLPQWVTRRQEVFELVADFEAAMSPAFLVDRLPLTGLDAETLGWLRPLVHQLWRSRYPAVHWTAEARRATAAADACYERLREQLRGQPELRCVAGACRRDFAALLSACRTLAHAIEQYPAEVKPT